MKYSFGISDFLEEIPSLSHSVVFFALITEGIKDAFEASKRDFLLSYESRFEDWCGA